MELEITNGTFVGTARWRAPRRVELDVADPDARAWLERYFGTEDSFLSGTVDCAELGAGRHDETETAFAHAAFALAAFSYRCRILAGESP